MATNQIQSLKTAFGVTFGRERIGNVDSKFVGLPHLVALALCAVTVSLSVGGIACARSLPSFTPEEVAWIKAHPVVPYAVDPKANPVEFVKNGEYQGLAAEYLAAVSRRSGLHFDLVETDSWEESQRRFLQGKVDLFPNASPYRVSETLARQLKFSDPYFSATSIIVTKANDPVVINLENLHGKVLAVRKGGFYANLVASHHPEIQIMLVEEPTDALNAVVSGTAYAAVGPDAVFIPMMRRKYERQLGVSGAFNDLPFTNQIAVRADLSLLSSIIDKSLKSLSAQETDFMNERWLEQADFGKPSLLSIIRYRAPLLFTVAVSIMLLGWFAYRARVAKHAAQASERAKAQFLAVMSHEIRTPLNAILGNLELLSRSPLSNVQKDRLQTIRTSSNGLLTIINDILDFSKIEAGGIAVERIEFNLVELGERALIFFGPIAKTKGIHLCGNFDVPFDHKVRGDAARISQVLHNLLGNALKFTAAGRVTLRLSIENDASGASALMVVEDTGIGISPEQQALLFRPFSQADSSINRRFGGSGLGLALSQRLARAMGGFISLRSEPKVGSQFTFHLPLGDAPKQPAPEPFSRELVVFLCEAEEWRKFIEPHLRQWNLQVETHANPSSIVEAQVEAASVLIVCGEDSSWPASEENRLVQDARWVIDLRSEGPAQPMRTGRLVNVSCYSLSGLRAILREVLVGDAHPAVAHGLLAAADATTSLLLPRQLRVLVAEDNPVNQQLFVEQLEVLGCQALVTPSGTAALEELSRGAWDLVLTDLNMPGMSGLELAAAVREQSPSLPVIAVTADASREERARCEEAGMRRVLTKPMSLTTLHEALAEFAGSTNEQVTEAADALCPPILRAKPIPTRLYDVFIASCAASLGALNAARTVEDASRVLAELHSLGGALNVYAQRSLAQQAMEISQGIKANGLQNRSEALDRFVSDLGHLMASSDRTVSSPRGPNNQHASRTRRQSDSL